MPPGSLGELMLKRRLLPWIAAGLCAMPLAGCGIAQQATSAMLSPFAATSRSIAADVQIATRAVSNMATRTAQSSRQIAATANQAAATQRAAIARTQSVRAVTYQTPTRAPKSARQRAPSQAQRDAGLDILPPDVLNRLTPDQAGLQRAAQTEAMKAPVGETIFWHIEGRLGSAMTESENMMGAFTCRTFVQTIALEDYFDQAIIKACRTSDGNWTQSF
jgi:surface antigen